MKEWIWTKNLIFNNYNFYISRNLVQKDDPVPNINCRVTGITDCSQGIELKRMCINQIWYYFIPC